MDWTPLLLAFERVTRMVDRRPLFVLAGANPGAYGHQLVAQATQLGIGGDLRTFFSLPPACLASLYAACDVFASPADSPSESFGLTVLEAMACGRPVVASDWDGYRELILHGQTGFKVHTDWADCLREVNELAPALAWEQEHLHAGQSVSVNVEQMADYLAVLLNNRQLREEMGQRGRARAETLYGWPVVISQWEALWGELAAIAGTVQGEQRDRLDYLQPCYFQRFSHYASRIVDDATPIQLTPRGRRMLAGRTPLLLHSSAQGFLDPQYVYAAAAAQRAAGWLRSCIPVGELVDILHRMHGLGRDRALMHVMWMAKYDLASLGGIKPLCDESSVD
jgi:hypothetical protein